MAGEPSITIDSPIDANVLKILVEPRDLMKEGQIVAIFEAMKMEINVVHGGSSGCYGGGNAGKPGTVVSPGAWIVVARFDKK